jgi:hypothetical protein
MIRRHAVLAMILFIITGALSAQERQSQRRPLKGLKHALNAAGAPDLNSEQEEQLRALLSESRQTQRDERPGTEVREARHAYRDAVLSSDNAAAQLQAEILASQIAAGTASKLENEASLKIQILNTLTQDQVDAVLQQSGTAGLFHLLGISGPGRRQGREPSPYFRR